VDYVTGNRADMKRYVRRVLIGTHSREIEGELMTFMRGQGWDLEAERPALLGIVEGGPMIRIDGVQLWANPRLARPDPAGLLAAPRLPGGICVKSCKEETEMPKKPIFHLGYHKIDSSSIQEWPLRQVFVSQRAKVIYCPIGKVACSFLKQQMVRISDVENPDWILQDVHFRTDHSYTGLHLKDYTPQEALSIISSPEMFRFAVLREPGARLLSAYMEKFVINRTMPNNIFHTRSVVEPVQRALGRTDPDFEHGVTFRQFITEVTSRPPRELDPHWRPQCLYLEGISYDRIYDFEEIDEVVSMLEARSGRRLPRQPSNVTGSGLGRFQPGAADLLPSQIEAIGQISHESFLQDDLQKAIKEYYQADYAILRDRTAKTRS